MCVSGSHRLTTDQSFSAESSSFSRHTHSGPSDVFPCQLEPSANIPREKRPLLSLSPFTSGSLDCASPAGGGICGHNLRKKGGHDTPAYTVTWNSGELSGSPTPSILFRNNGTRLTSSQRPRIKTAFPNLLHSLGVAR